MYEFDPNGEPPAREFRSIAINQLDAALSALDPPNSLGRSAVHEARRRIKKLRGLLQLVRPAFPAFSFENAALRDAAGLLSPLRDREVRHETLGVLAEWRPTPLLRRLLVASAAAAPGDDPAALEDFRDRLTAIRRRAEHWSLSRSTSGMDPLWLGVRHTYRAARRRMAKAKRAPTPTHFHEWRKSNKVFGFQLELLQKAAPETLAGDLAVVDKLSVMLGVHHDLAVLRGAADRQQLPPMNASEHQELRDLVAERLDKLESDAFGLGRQIYAESPRAFTHRLQSYWMTTKS